MEPLPLENCVESLDQHLQDETKNEEEEEEEEEEHTEVASVEYDGNKQKTGNM